MKKQFFFFGGFLSFLFGYFLLYWVVPVPLVIAPELTGKTIAEGFSLAADKSVGLYLMKEINDEAYLDGMIIEQYPLPGTPMRLHQYCFVSVVRHVKKESPNLVGKSLKEVILFSETSGHDIQIFEYRMPGVNEGIVIAQFEKKQLNQTKKEIVCLVGSDKKGSFLMPDLKRKNLAQIKKQVEQYQWQFDLIYKDKEDALLSDEELLILDQRPAAEMFCSEANELFVQCLVVKK